MKRIFHLIGKDIKVVVTNYVAFIIVLALCVLPSLYAWFNIKASWDPYSSEATRGIQIGVVNKDKGATLAGKELYIGEKVVDGLKENKQLGWQFVDEKTAETNIEEGKYYAVITIPEGFSTSLTSILTTEIKKGEIIYTVNEKLNAIAPKLTDKGVTAIQEMITKTVVQTVSHSIFQIGKEIGINLENELPKLDTIYSELKNLESHFGEVNQTVDSADIGITKLKRLISKIERDMPKIEETIGYCRTLSTNVAEFVDTSKQVVNQIGPSIKQDLFVIENVANEIVSQVSALESAIESGSEKAPAIVASLQDKVTSLQRVSESLLKLANALNKLSPNNPLDSFIMNLQKDNNLLVSASTLLSKVEAQLQDGAELDYTTLNNVINAFDSIGSIAGTLNSKMDSMIIPTINTIFSDATKVAEGAIDILDAAKEKLPEVKNLLSTAFTSVEKGEKGLAFVKEKLPTAEKMIMELSSALGKIKDNQDLRDMVELLKADVKSRSDFLTTPVEIREEKLFPMGNYGTGMTPFYTVLCLWVGALLMSSLLTVHAHGENKAYQEYFGKLGIFLLISWIQAFIVSIGDLYLLKIYCVNPLLFVLGNIYIASVFAIIIYSLVSVFGNVGKVIGIILLVLQVAGSGGTFPIQLTPHFFQVINPYLPFTYGISFNREAIGGVVETVLRKDSLIMFLYLIIAMIGSLVFKRIINQLARPFVKKFEESELGE